MAPLGGGRAREARLGADICRGGSVVSWPSAVRPVGAVGPATPAPEGIAGLMDPDKSNYVGSCDLSLFWTKPGRYIVQEAHDCSLACKFWLGVPPAQSCMHLCCTTLRLRVLHVAIYSNA